MMQKLTPTEIQNIIDDPMDHPLKQFWREQNLDIIGYKNSHEKLVRIDVKQQENLVYACRLDPERPNMLRTSICSTEDKKGVFDRDSGLGFNEYTFFRMAMETLMLHDHPYLESFSLDFHDLYANAETSYDTKIELKPY